MVTINPPAGVLLENRQLERLQHLGHGRVARLKFNVVRGAELCRDFPANHTARRVFVPTIGRRSFCTAGKYVGPRANAVCPNQATIVNVSYRAEPYDFNYSGMPVEFRHFTADIANYAMKNASLTEVFPQPVTLDFAPAATEKPDGASWIDFTDDPNDSGFDNCAVGVHSLSIIFFIFFSAG